MIWRWNQRDPFEGTRIDGPRGVVYGRVARAVEQRWPQASAAVIAPGPLGLRALSGAGDGRQVDDEAAIRAALASGEPREGTHRTGQVAWWLPLFGVEGPIAALQVVHRERPEAGERAEAEELARLASARLLARRYALRARIADRLARMPVVESGAGAIAMAALDELGRIAGAVAGTVMIDRAGRLVTVADHGRDAIARRERMAAGIPFGEGVSWQAMTTGAPRFVPNYQEEAAALPDLPVEPHLFVVPLAGDGAARWVLIQAFAEDAPPTLDALALVEEAAPVVASALQAAAAAEVEDRLTDLLERVPDLDLAKLPEAILKVAVEVVPGTDSGAIFLRGPDDRRFRARASHGYALAQDDGPVYSEGALAAWHAPERQRFDAHAPRILTLPGAAGWTGLARRVGHRPRRELDVFWRSLHSDLSVPVTIDGDVRAFLTLHARTRDDAFGRDSVRTARQVAATAAVALRIALERERSRREAVTDALTGLLNRRGAEAELTRTLARAQRAQNPFSLVLIDLGGFKAINDRYGHDTGDEALRAVGRVLRTEVRAGDAAARWGGDEFVVLLPQQDREEAAATAARLAAALAAIPVGEGALVAHVGTASYPEDADEADALVRIADERMYRAKRGD